MEANVSSVRSLSFHHSLLHQINPRFRSLRKSSPNLATQSRLDGQELIHRHNSTGEFVHRQFHRLCFPSSSPGWESGSGSITIPLVNLRSDYQFRIFHWDESEITPKKHDHDHNPIPGTRHLLAQSELVSFEHGRGPEQVHLALTGRVGEMRVLFVTHDGKESFVKYGLTRNKLGQVAAMVRSR